MNITSLKILTANCLTHPLIGTALRALYGGRMPAGDFSICLSDPHISPRSAAYLFWGFYEKAERAFVDRYLRSDLDVVELGASLGIVALHILRKQTPGKQFVTVEANPKLLPTIETNLQTNFPTRSVSVLNRAIDYEGRSEVLISLNHDHLASSLPEHQVEGAGSQLPIQTTTLSRILEDHSIGDYALVSDIECAEIAMIHRDGAALRRCRQMIIELHPGRWHETKYTVDDVVAAIQNLHGFKIVDASGPVYVFDKL